MFGKETEGGPRRCRLRGQRSGGRSRQEGSSGHHASTSAEFVWSPVRVFQKAIGGIQIREVLGARVPLQMTLRFVCDVADQRGAGREMPGQDIRIALPAATYTIQEITRVQGCALLALGALGLN